MFYLASNEFPTSATELEAALTGAFRELFALPAGLRAVAVEDDHYPNLRAIRIDLTGATLNAQGAPPKPVGVGPRTPGVSVSQLQISGHPMRAAGAAINLGVAARDARFEYDRTGQGRPMIVLASAAEGRVEASVTRANLEALLLAGAQEPARRQGVVVERTTLTLTSRGPRALAVDLRVTARKRVVFADVTAVVRIEGRLDIDDDLTARLSALSCQGEGVVGGIVSGFITPQLEKFEGRELPLMAFSLGDVRLRDVQIGTADGLQVTAAFGS